MLPLKRYRSGEPGVADLLPWAALVDDGVVLTKGGALIAGWYYRGSDVESIVDGQRNQVAHVVNTGLSQMESGWVLWCDAIRFETEAYSPPEASSFESEVAQRIDDERREAFEGGDVYDTARVMLVMYTPPARVERKVMRIFSGGEIEKEAGWNDEALRIFHQGLSDLEDRLSAVLAMERMGQYLVDGRLHDGLVDHLHYLVAGEGASISIPSSGMYLDALIGGVELEVGETLTVHGGHDPEYVDVLTISGFPGESWPMMLSALESLPISYRWSTRFIFLSQEEAISELHKYRRKWAQQRRGFVSQVFNTGGSGSINLDADEMAQEAEVAITDARGQKVRFGFYTSVIVLRNSNYEHLRAIGREVRKVVQRLEFGCRLEKLNTLEAWLGSLAGLAEPNIRRPAMHTLTLADLLPLSKIWTGRADAPCPLYPEGSPPLLHVHTTGSTPFRLNLHVGDLGHTLVFGPTGAGKSVLLNVLAAQFLRYRNASICVFDRGRSAETLCKGAGGSHFALAWQEGEARLAPLEALDDEQDLVWACEWIELCYRLQTGKEATMDQREKIRKTLMLMRSTPEHRSVTEFRTTVQDKELRDAMGFYAMSEDAPAPLDGQRDEVPIADYTVFELEELLSLGETRYLPVLAYLFRKFEKSLNGQPAMLQLGEAWALLAHPVFREKIRDWLKTLRKKNCAVIVETQSISDAARSGMFDVLLESCPTRLLLPNAEAGKGGGENPGPLQYYEAMGLTSADVEIIQNAIPKREYYYVSPEGKRLFELRLGQMALAYCAVSDRESLEHRARFEEKYGEKAWRQAWEQHCGAGRRSAGQ